MTRSNYQRTREMTLDDFVMEPDFNPADLLADILRTRTIEEGVSIDPEEALLIDDGFWIIDKSAITTNDRTGGWTIKTMIADVAAMMPEESELAKAVTARFQGPERIIGQKERRRIRTFPHDYLNNYVSLHQNETRPVLAFTMEISTNFDLQSYKVERSAFRNLRKCSLGPLQTQMKGLRVNTDSWTKLIRKIQEKHLNNMAHDCDKIAEGRTPSLHKEMMALPSTNEHSLDLVQGLMRLTNIVARDFVMTNGLDVPSFPHDGYFDSLHNSKDGVFNKVCDAVARDVIRRYSRQNVAKIKLTSPMQSYSDYLTFRIVANKVDGKPASPELRREAKRLTAIFTTAAGESRARTAEYVNNHNSKKHPFDVLTPHPDDAQSVKLNNWAKSQGFERPDVAVRRLTVQGGHCFMVGIEQKLPEFRGGYERAWGVSLKYEQAREIAAFRLMERIQPQQRPHRAPSNQR